jgi:hypothetical protein
MKFKKKTRKPVTRSRIDIRRLKKTCLNWRKNVTRLRQSWTSTLLSMMPGKLLLSVVAIFFFV